VYDGFDMMSSGNGFLRSDLAAASKWFYNWITNDAVVMMQPEGPTSNCPDCLAFVQNLTLKPFDNVNVQPSASNKMAVHIPILGRSTTRAYSYWLSYRSGNDGLAAGGLSIHVSWFDLGGIFGGSYDSLNYDAFGGTETTSDSFVLPGTCYVVAPSILMMGIDKPATEEVQPVVCVDSVNEGTSISISVSFLDPESPPSPSVSVDTQVKMECSEKGARSEELTFDLSNNKIHLLHYNKVGDSGEIDANLCFEAGSSSARAVAYFYDS